MSLQTNTLATMNVSNTQPGPTFTGYCSPIPFSKPSKMSSPAFLAESGTFRAGRNKIPPGSETYFAVLL